MVSYGCGIVKAIFFSIKQQNSTKIQLCHFCFLRTDLMALVAFLAFSFLDAPHACTFKNAFLYVISDEFQIMFWTEIEQCTCLHAHETMAVSCLSVCDLLSVQHRIVLERIWHQMAFQKYTLKQFQPDQLAHTDPIPHKLSFHYSSRWNNPASTWKEPCKYVSFFFPSLVSSQCFWHMETRLYGSGILGSLGTSERCQGI